MALAAAAGPVPVGSLLCYILPHAIDTVLALFSFTHITMLCSCAALSGCPPMLTAVGGFFLSSSTVVLLEN